MKTKLLFLFIALCLFANSQNPDATPQDDIYIKTIFNLQNYASGNNTYDIAFVAIEVKKTTLIETIIKSDTQMQMVRLMNDFFVKTTILTFQ